MRSEEDEEKEEEEEEEEEEEQEQEQEEERTSSSPKVNPPTTLRPYDAATSHPKDPPPGLAPRETTHPRRPHTTPVKRCDHRRYWSVCPRLSMSPSYSVESPDQLHRYINTSIRRYVDILGIGSVQYGTMFQYQVTNPTTS